MNKEELREMIQEELLKEGFLKHVMFTLIELPGDIDKLPRGLEEGDKEMMADAGRRIMKSLRQKGIKL